MNRYRTDRRIKGGTTLGTNGSIARIKAAVRDGELQVSRYRLKEGERLEHIAGRYLGDARLWWVLSATSNIGWSLQVPAGTVINIPLQLDKINAMV